MLDFSSLGIVKDAGATDEEIRAAEDRLGVAFPASYRELVRYSREAKPTHCVFEFGNEQTCISEFFKFTVEDDLIGIVTQAHLLKGIIPENLVAFARDPGDWLICFEFKVGEQPRIVVFVAEEHRTQFVSDNFDSFVSKLHA